MTKKNRKYPTGKELEALKKAALKGFESAGFVHVKAEAEFSDFFQCVRVQARGACPCGLGESSMAVAIQPSELCQSLPAHIKRLFKRSGLLHIERDKAEGRWK